MIEFTKAAWQHIRKLKPEFLIRFPYTTHVDPPSLPAPFTSEITADLLDMAWKFRGVRRPIILMLINIEDWGIILNYTSIYRTDGNKFAPGTLMGIPVWKTTSIERGTARSYYSWESAYNDLKDTLEPADVKLLKRKMEAERGL